MIVLTLAASILAFVAVLHFAGAVGLARKAASIAGGAAAVMRSPDLGDDEKERRVQRAALQLFGSFAAISLVVVAALAAVVAIVGFGAAIGLYQLDDAISVAASWPFILGSSVAMIVVWLSLHYARRGTRELDAR